MSPRGLATGSIKTAYDINIFNWIPRLSRGMTKQRTRFLLLARNDIKGFLCKLTKKFLELMI
ncbi:hypothetical protein [Rickettsia asembonensis]|uniref:hypothetical protein n=1 Tax=Rickettsia asembonensis TaxID=1068590 RepID=UPI000B2BB724|nr:hypothetical protein [Rickettsia asembonensis]